MSDIIQHAMKLNNFHPDEPFESVAHVFSKGKLYRPSQLECAMAHELEVLQQQLAQAKAQLHSYDELFDEKQGAWLDEVAQLKGQLEQVNKKQDALQAKIDALMFEYCPEDMTDEQIEEYEKHLGAVDIDFDGLAQVESQQ